MNKAVFVLRLDLIPLTDLPGYFRKSVFVRITDYCFVGIFSINIRATKIVNMEE